MRETLQMGTEAYGLLRRRVGVAPNGVPGSSTMLLMLVKDGGAPPAAASGVRRSSTIGDTGVASP
jgi:hypothetical protein